MKWLMSLREPMGRLLRWMLDIQEYDFQMEHWSGVSPIMATADALSRVYNREDVDIPGESVATVEDEDPVWDLPDKAAIKDEQRHDLGDLEDFVERHEDGQYVTNEEELMIRVVGGIPMMYTPEKLQLRILRYFHGAPTRGHLGVARTLRKLERHFWGATIAKDVSHFVRSCVICATEKLTTTKRQG
uniref:Integrase zinc-binding domain-containing protein n=1 Tax=Rhodosorus marinus TaxID=101924 RepID=A0A7S0G551_9RHOD|mmetsp:Transcript_7293/g.10888  ORF Transcript_7293/g.10888 Transcript_7293/m.10888 type:complete len:187 (+) Transcript_7293:975-1535(+)